MTGIDDLDVSLVDDFPDMHRVLATLRAQAPVVQVRCYGAPAWMILSYDGVRDALLNEEIFPSEAAYSKSLDPAVGRTLNTMKGAEHRRNRAVISPSFRRQNMASYGHDLIERVCRALVDRFRTADTVDLKDVLTHLLPMVVITQLLGLPWRDYQALERWSTALFTYPMDPEGALRAKAELTVFLEEVIAERRVEPRDDLVTKLVVGEFQGRRLQIEEILSFLRLLFPAGTHNTTNAIGNMFFALLQEPELIRRTRDDADSRFWAVEETLRWEPPLGNLPRQARSIPTTFHGVDIPADSPMVFSLAAANRDPDVFDQPHRFDLDRHAPESLTFGLGEHFCIGAWLARQQMRVALDLLLETTTELRLVDPEAARPKGSIQRGPRCLPVTIEWA